MGRPPRHALQKKVEQKNKIKTMKELLKKIWYSSQDPARVSLTIKSVGAFLASFGLLQYVGFGNEDVNNLAEAVGQIVASVGVLISSVGVIWGVARKFKKPSL